MLMQVRVPDAARDFSPRVKFQSRLLWCLYSLHVQSHASTPVHTLKIPNTGSIPLFGHMKILHKLTGMGSTAITATVPYPGKVTQICRKGQRSSKNKNKIKN